MQQQYCNNNSFVPALQSEKDKDEEMNRVLHYFHHCEKPANPSRQRRLMKKKKDNNIVRPANRRCHTNESS